jgi:hypothetical protein
MHIAENELTAINANKLLKWLRDSEVSQPETWYRKDSMEDYRFYAGRQDSNQALAALNAQDRPATVFNEIKPKIDMLIGLAAQSKHDPLVEPVGTEDGPLAELMTGVLKHYRRKLNMSRKELEGFEHAVKGGRSLLHFYVNTDNPFKPQISVKRFHGRHFYLDPESQEYDMSDARFLFLESWLGAEELKQRYPDFDISQYQGWVTGGAIDLPSFFNEARDKYRICECWYYKVEDTVWFQNPLNGQVENLSPAAFKEFVKACKEGIPLGPNGEKKQFQPPEPVPGKKKNYYYKIFSGTLTLEEGPSPYKFDGFPDALYGAYRDEDTNAWFGAIRLQKDPQRAINTMRRQLSHLLQTLPKGILVHETGAILNIEEYEKNSAKPGFHLELAMNGMGKYKFETQPNISPIYAQYSDVCSQSLKDISGIQNEMMGQETSSRTPGVTVRNRQETNLAVLYTLYDNYKESRINGDKILLKFCQQYTSDGEIVRILGPEGASLIQINTQLNPEVQGFNDIRIGEYDIAMSEMNETSTTRQAFAGLLMDYSQNNPGAIPPDMILEYADAPYSAIQKVKESNQASQQASQLEKDRLYELELLKIQVKADGQETDAVIKVRELQIQAREKAATNGKE